MFITFRLSFVIGIAGHKRPKKNVDKPTGRVVQFPLVKIKLLQIGGGLLGSVIKKRRKKMRKHKHKKLLARTRHQRRKGK
jgi:hypothetical protein